MLGLLIPVLMGSCIKEDYDDCDNVTIAFKYFADGDRDVLSQYISIIDLYVFDADERLVDVYHYSQSEISGEIAFRLPGGTYQVVAVGNAYDRTASVGVEGGEIDNMFITHPAWGGNGTLTGHDDNYLGTATIQVPETEGKKSHSVVVLRSAHVDVSIEIHGLAAPQSGELPCRLVIEQANAATSFRNVVDGSQQGTYCPELVYDAASGCYRTDDLALLRMDNDGTLDPDLCRHIIRLEDTDGNVLVEERLYDFLQRYEDELDVTRQEALLPMSIIFRPLEVEVDLPVWYIEDITPGWN